MEEASAAYLDDMYRQWREDPESVDPSWQRFFRGYELGLEGCGSPEGARAQSNVASLIYAYRSLGHLMAWTDPLGDPPAEHPAFALQSFGLSEADLDRRFDTGHLPGEAQLPLREIIQVLRDTYCRTMGVEYIHIQDRRMRRWLQEQMEPGRNRPELSAEQRRAILEHLMDAELFERFVHARYPGQKRFSLEGGESLIPALAAITERGVSLGIEEIVLGMAHRGRLNVLSNLLGMPHELIFTEFEGNFLPDSVQGDGDVKYHKGYSTTREIDGRPLHVTLTANPSHLEAVYPVVEGRARAKQRQRDDLEHRRRVLPLVLHGDAAFAGQGIVAETLNLSQLPGYQTGGTLHIVVNNQIGFTTSPEEARSTAYATDVAKLIEAPIFHVNGDDPEAVVHAVDIALRFRQEFGRDAVVDLVCYRRHGHNEGDEPAFTQPVLYRKVRKHPSVRALYTTRLVEQGVITAAQEQRIAERFREVLTDAYELVKEQNPTLQVHAFEKHWEGLGGPFSFEPVETGVPHERLERVARAYCTVPQGFKLNPKVARALPPRLAAVQQRESVDWAFAEILAFGSLLAEGTPVRLSGQDSARGTFSQRHLIWQHMDSGARFSPLSFVDPQQARLCVYNSALSEASVLAFEYGYSVTEPRMLIIWEAQFGDFANGAQVIIDQFIVDSESKWQRDSGLVLLLPHGYEGQGPEHSSAYLERFLLACAENNIQVCYPSTPAQHFHLLRRQVRRAIRLPLVLMSPKSLLRNPLCVSPVAQLEQGTFEEVLDDPTPPERARRVVLCSGKLFWELFAQRQERGVDGVALVRVEQFYPFPEQQLQAVLRRYPEAKELVWAQEESRNRGGWLFLYPRLVRLTSGRLFAYVGREASASPITGSLKIFRREQNSLVSAALQRPLGQPGAEGICVDVMASKVY